MAAKGFSLIEACLALIVIGLVSLPVIHNYNVEQVRKRIGKTEDKNLEISYALGQFYNEFDRYPCPADLSLGPDDPSYGMEVCPGAPGSIPVSSPILGHCASGICRSYADGSTTETILYGGVPFRNLKISVDTTLDAWSRKISYVVTERLANTNAVFPPVPAPPSIINGRAITYYEHEVIAGVGEQTNTMQYESQVLLISHGEDGNGAYTADGVLTGTPVINLSTGVMVSPCNQNTLAGLDSENCDNDGLFWNTQYGAKAPGARHYDDIILSITSPPTYIWNPAVTDPNNAYASFSMGIGTPEVGVMLDANGDIVREAPSALYPDGKPVLYDSDGDNITDITLDVAGTIRADQAKSSEICSNDGDDCFDPADIGGTSLGIDCSAGSNAANANGVIVGVAGGSASCATVLGPVASGGCTAAQRITGFVNGVAQCATVTP